MDIFTVGLFVFLLAYLLSEELPNLSIFMLSLYTWILCATFIVTISFIPTSSMAFTASRGESAVVQKSYGTVHYSTAAGLWYRGDIYAPFIQLAKPQEGDIITFIMDPNSRIEYLKRVIAIGGDKVQFINGQLIINDIPCKYEYLRTQKYFNDEKRLVEYDIYRETSPRGHSREIAMAKPQSMEDYARFQKYDNTKPTIVPEDHVYYAGDNRRNSTDARYYGPVPLKFVTGKAIISLAKGYHFAPYGSDNIEDAYGMGIWSVFMTILLILAAILSAVIYEFDNIGCKL